MPRSCPNRRVLHEDVAGLERVLRTLRPRHTDRARRLTALTTHGAETGTIARLIRNGRITLLDRRIAPPIDAPAAPKARAEDAPIELRPVATRTAWIRILVVHHRTGQPFAGVQLDVRLPDGQRRRYETRPDGVVQVDHIDRGVCDVTCDLDDARLSETLGFVGWGPPAAADDGVPHRPARVSADDGPPRAQWIANVESHRVQAGETVATIAEANGMTPAGLARFNWGVTSPAAVNRALYDCVGCTRTNVDGRTYRLDSTDEPGLVFVPRPWAATGLATEQTHVIRVRIAAGLRLVLENQDGLRIPEAAYEATMADGTVHEGRLGRSGIALLDDPAPGPVEVIYLDYDDVEAKSLAACARRALDERNLDEVIRVLRHSRWMIRQVIAAYDTCYNDYTGGGLLADIDHEAVDPDDRAVIEALLRIAHLHADPAEGGADASGPAANPPAEDVTPTEPAATPPATPAPGPDTGEAVG